MSWIFVESSKVRIPSFSSLQYGGAIYSRGNVKITGCSFVNSTAYGSGGEALLVRYAIVTGIGITCSSGRRIWIPFDGGRNNCSDHVSANGGNRPFPEGARVRQTRGEKELPKRFLVFAEDSFARRENVPKIFKGLFLKLAPDMIVRSKGRRFAHIRPF